MKCLKCKKNNIVEKMVRDIFDFKNESIKIAHSTWECIDCGYTFADIKQMNQLRQLLADAYRKKHHLLTSTDIKNYRKRLGMTQFEFAKYLNTGEASIKRWETCYVQDPVYDDHIRLKCDERYAEQNLVILQNKRVG